VTAPVKKGLALTREIPEDKFVRVTEASYRGQIAVLQRRGASKQMDRAWESRACARSNGLLVAFNPGKWAGLSTKGRILSSLSKKREEIIGQRDRGVV
jgi:hypothetical protein